MVQNPVYTYLSTDLEKYILGVLIAADQTAASILFEGRDDLTISTRCGMALLDERAGLYNSEGPHGIPPWALRALGTALNDVQRDHCFQAIRDDQNRAVDVIFLLRPYLNLLGDPDAPPG